MPIYHRQFNPGELQFVTSSTYRRTPLFRSETLAENFSNTLAKLRDDMGFGLQGWVLMPDHFHLLFRPIPADAASLIVKQLKQQTAHHALVALKIEFNAHLERQNVSPASVIADAGIWQHPPPRLAKTLLRFQCLHRNQILTKSLNTFTPIQ